MKTPSQRKRDRKKSGKSNDGVKFKTQFDIDMDNGFVPYEYGRHSAVNYREVKKRVEAEKKRFLMLEKKKVEEAVRIEAEKKQVKEKLKNQTIFDIIDIED